MNFVKLCKLRTKGRLITSYNFKVHFNNSDLEEFCKKVALKNFIILTEKRLQWSNFLEKWHTKTCNFSRNRAPFHMNFCKF